MIVLGVCAGFVLGFGTAVAAGIVSLIREAGR